MLKIERDPVLVEAIRVLQEDPKSSQNRHIFDDLEDFDDFMNNDDDLDDDNIIDGDYGDDYMGL